MKISVEELEDIMYDIEANEELHTFEYGQLYAFIKYFIDLYPDEPEYTEILIPQELEHLIKEEAN